MRDADDESRRHPMTSNDRSDPGDSPPLLVGHPAVRPVAVVLWLFAGFVALMLAIPATAGWVQNIDDAVFRIAVANEIPVLVTLGEVLAFVGSVYVMAPLMVIVAVFLSTTKRWNALWAWLLTIGISQFLIGSVKALYARERPPLPLVETTGYAFPSGHALTGAAVAIGLVIVLTSPDSKRRYVGIIAIVYALVMAWSRVYVRAHWVSDVSAGLAFGAAAAITAALIIDRMSERRAG
ncbi:MAG: phosphatase PAP2 family protein [Actinomycetia bacterium]|nr:phosphatase PAP2 family protein [Actinomycetes bacterium]